MTLRSLMLACAAFACTGCVGIALDIPRTEVIQNPLPLKEATIFGGDKDFDRWACQPEGALAARQTKRDFRQAWGEPREKVVTASGETWIYVERGRWCGLWIFAIVPLPIVLPVCETYDKVDFEGEAAVRSVSQRMTGFATGLVITPYGPVPAMSRAGRVSENRQRVSMLPGPESASLACVPPSLTAASTKNAVSPKQTKSGPLVPPAGEYVNCAVNGERQWTYQSRCD